MKYDALRLELDRIVRQRNTLLKQAGGRLTDEIESSLDVWDVKFADARRTFGPARATLVERCGPMVAEAYGQLAGQPTDGRARVRTAVAARRAGGRARGRRDGRRAPRRVDGRPAPRRTGADARRPAGAHACVAGRATHARAGAAAGRPPAGGRAHRVDARARARRRAVRARPVGAPARCSSTFPRVRS